MTAKKKKLSIFLPIVHAGENAMALTTSLLSLFSESKYIITVNPEASGPYLSEARNITVAKFLAGDWDYFLSVDTDIYFKTEALDNLIARDLPIVGGCYLSRLPGEAEKTGPVCIVKRSDADYGRATWEDFNPPTGLHQVIGLGMGFTLIRREVMTALGIGPLWPFAETVVHDYEVLGLMKDPRDGVMHNVCSEDITFCLRAAARGFTPWLDLDTKVGHVKKVGLHP